MTSLVTLDDVKTWTFQPQPENEAQLDLIAQLATGIVLDYIGPDPVTQSDRAWTVVTVPDNVRTAILTLCAHLWAHRGDEGATSDESQTKAAATGHLPSSVTWLLQRFRDPVVS